jgi:prenyltransferase beta subunit
MAWPYGENLVESLSVGLIGNNKTHPNKKENVDYIHGQQALNGAVSLT